MILARVIGQVIATQKEPSHEGKKILLIQALNLQDEPTGDPFVALDAVDAGIGDRVLAIQEGFSAMTAVGHTDAPIDAAIIGVVDAVELVEME
jgi:microcompartment protein CcmK/EutM